VKTKKISLTNEQYNTIKLLFSCASTDDSRPILNYVYYNSKTKEIFATDGHVLRCEDIDLGEDSLFFDRLFFTLPVKKYWFICAKFEEFKIDALIEDEDNKYPDLALVIPPKEAHRVHENGLPVCIDLSTLDKIKKSIADTHAACCFVTTHSAISAIKIYRIGWGDDSYKFIGLIMPVRFLGFDEFQKLTPKPIGKEEVVSK
jgi:hypothetical protein